MKIYVSAKEMIKKFDIPYSRINYLMQKNILTVEKKKGKRRLYSLEDAERALAR
ncbi:MAG: hypothetical protein ABIJ27_04125 [Candidatus Omnitrophota bacterium]